MLLSTHFHLPLQLPYAGEQRLSKRLKLKSLVVDVAVEGVGDKESHLNQVRVAAARKAKEKARQRPMSGKVSLMRRWMKTWNQTTMKISHKLSVKSVPQRVHPRAQRRVRKQFSA